MGLSVGLDVSWDSVLTGIADQAGCIVREARDGGDPKAVLGALRSRADHVLQIGLETEPTSAWIAGRLLEAGLPVAGLETLPPRSRYDPGVLFHA